MPQLKTADLMIITECVIQCLIIGSVYLVLLGES